VSDPFDEPRELAARVVSLATGREILVASDFDGTLAPIVPRPDDATLREDSRAALAALAGRAHVAIVSGRELSKLRARVALPGIALAGEHGGDLLLPSGERSALELSKGAREALDAFGRFADLLLAGTGGEVERKKLATAAHTRRIEKDRDRLESVLLARGREIGATSGQVEAIPGRRVVELRAQGASKGLGLVRIKAALAPRAFVVALGDDRTDEDLFREVLRDGGMAVRVGAGETCARQRVEGPEAVARFLEALAQWLPLRDA
jgi:trehalose 6-phosphate synthase/phosphatase